MESDPKLQQGTQDNHDVMVDDGGSLYYLLFPAGVNEMTERQVVADFLDGYDGDCEPEEVDVVFP